MAAGSGAWLGRRDRVDSQPHARRRGVLRTEGSYFGRRRRAPSGELPTDQFRPNRLYVAVSMAVGEYVSVSSQRDAELADIEVEKSELAGQPAAELQELATIYIKRGLDEGLAMRVAEQLSLHDRLGAHLRDELGISGASIARPIQAACISAASFASFAALPVLALVGAPASLRSPAIALISLASLAALGALGGHLGGAPMGRASLRVTIGGALAMAVTAAIGRVLGGSVG